jgi:hypothetical protein
LAWKVGGTVMAVKIFVIADLTVGISFEYVGHQRRFALTQLSELALSHDHSASCILPRRSWS